MGITTGAPRITTNQGRAVWRVGVTGSTADTLEFDVPTAHSDMLSQRADATLVALLLPAMRTAQPLSIGGNVTDELLHNARADGPIQTWVRSVLPMYQAVPVTAARTAPAGPRPHGVATGFSAGVDSYSTLADYLFEEHLPDSMRITHLLFNDVGSHSTGKALADVRLANVRKLAAAWDAPVVDVRSNLDTHFTGIGTNTAFMNTHTVRNAAVAHLLAGRLGTWYYAAAVAFRDVHGGPSEAMGTADPIGLPLLSTTALSLISAGGERTRIQKTLQVAQMHSARAGLDVCTDGDPLRDRNCSKCDKCLRTMLTLEMAGHLDHFCPARFDRDVYATHRLDFMITVLASEAPLHREIARYAAATGFPWPASARRRAVLRRARTVAASAARTVKRRSRP